MSTTFVKEIKPFQKEYMITTERTAYTGHLWWKKPLPPIEQTYVGNGTVWHHFPSGVRCSTPTESLLSDLLTAWKWGSPK